MGKLELTICGLVNAHLHRTISEVHDKHDGLGKLKEFVSVNRR